MTENIDTRLEVNRASRGRRAAELAWTFLAPFVGLLVVVLIFQIYHWVYKPQQPFLTAFQVQLIAKQTTIVGMGALGMTVIIISGGIDLSAGSLLALTSVVLAVLLREDVAGWLSRRTGLSPEASLHVWAAAAFLLVLMAGAGAGALNGLAITGLRLVPFIVTLGTMLVFRGAAEWLADQGKVVLTDSQVPVWLSTLLDPPAADWQLVCTGVWIVIVLGALLAGVLRFSVFGRYVFALGSNESAARLCGINVPVVKLSVYALGGLFMALAGVFQFNNMNKQGDPTSGIARELDIIAAVVIGGGSLSGGRGSVLGSIIGALTMTTLRNGCRYAEVSNSMQQMVIGAIIIAAVAIDQIAHRGEKS